MHKDIEVDMTAVFVLSHGGRAQVENPDIEEVENGSMFITSDGKQVSEFQIYKDQKRKSLIHFILQIATEFIIREVKKITKLLGKPKFFTFQCCQGSKEEFVQVEEIQADRNISTITMPTEDTLILYAASPGQSAYRNINSGSWLITYLCDIFMTNAKEMHLVKMIGLVQARFKKPRSGTLVGEKVKTQCPQVSNRGFTKMLYFNPGLYKNEAGKVVKVDLMENNNQENEPAELVFNMDEINAAARAASSSNAPAK